MHAQSLDLHQRTGQRPGNQRCQRRAAEEDGNRLAALGGRQPAGEVVDHPGEEARFGNAQQKAQHVELGFVLHEGHGSGHQPPGEHDAGQPQPCADLLQQHVRGHFEQRVANEEQAGAKAIGRSADAQVAFQMRADEADVDAVQVVDDEHDDEQRQDVALDLGHGAGQGVAFIPGRRSEGIVHLRISH